MQKAYHAERGKEIVSACPPSKQSIPKRPSIQKSRSEAVPSLQSMCLGTDASRPCIPACLILQPTVSQKYPICTSGHKEGAFADASTSWSRSAHKHFYNDAGALANRLSGRAPGRTVGSWGGAALTAALDLESSPAGCRAPHGAHPCNHPMHETFS